MADKRMMADRRWLVKFAGVFCLVTLVSALAAAPAVYALGLENVKVWKWTGYTQCYASAVGDVDGDGSVEIVTGGYYLDGTRIVAQLCVWDGTTLTLENVAVWYWGDDTRIGSVAVGDVDGDAQTEIVTGGLYHDGTRQVAQLCVWDGTTLTLENVAVWYWTSDTLIWSVAVGDVDDDGSVEIVTGGYYYDYSRYVAQLCVWSGSTLNLENVATWYWGLMIWGVSVAVGDVDDDGSVEIVTGGSYYDGTRMVAQLHVWSGSTLTLEQVTTWFWGGLTILWQVAVGDVDDDGSLEIVTGGWYHDGALDVAQLCVWDGSTLTLENVVVWHWTDITFIYSVAVGDVDDDGSVEIVTGGHYDYYPDIAQLCVWDGSTLTLEDVAVWYWTSDTPIYSVAVGDVDSDGSAEIVTGGACMESNAQLTVWTSA